MKPVQNKFDKEKYTQLLKSEKEKEKEKMSKKQDTLTQFLQNGKKLQYLVLKKKYSLEDNQTSTNTRKENR